MKNQHNMTRKEMLDFIKEFYEQAKKNNQKNLEQWINRNKNRISAENKKLDEALCQCEKDEDVLLENYNRILEYLKDHKPVLEHLTNYVGLTKLFIESPESTYNIFVDYLAYTDAYHESLRALRGLEYGNIGTSHLVKIGILFWYVSLENYLTPIIRCFLMREQDENNPILEKNVLDKLNYLLKKVDFDRERLKKLKIHSQLEDFKDLRNQIVHAGYHKISKFSNSQFGEAINLKNADIIQAMVICLKIFNLFRYIIPELDLMPDIRISLFNGPSVSKKLDYLYEDCYLPALKEILAKHNLRTNITIEFPKYSISPVDKLKNIDMGIRVDSKYEPTYNFSQENTQIVDNYLFEMQKNILREEDIQLGQFTMPNYYKK